MLIKKVTAVVFSPTGGTKRYGAEIAKRLSASYKIIDLTGPEQRRQEYSFGQEDLVIFGAPVYYGRLPQVEGDIFRCCRGNNTAAVFNITYGNGQYGDALLEEKDLLENQGFMGIAAGAWIAPHSFSERIAANRPDSADLEALDAFAAVIKKRLQGAAPNPNSLAVPGNRPYRDIKPLAFYPQGDDNCVDCRTCVKVCPTGAIDHEEPIKTEASKCILCLACVKECPWDSRSVQDGAFVGVCQNLEANLLVTAKTPEIFIAP